MEHHFEVEDAVKYGVHKAILLYNFRFWILHNMVNKRNQFDEHTWTYNSARAFSKLFPYMKPRTIKTWLNELVKAGVLLCGNYNKVGYDKTSWYAFKDEKPLLLILSDHDSNRQMECQSMANGMSVNGKPIPDSKPNNKPNNIDIAKKPISSKKSVEPIWEEFIKAHRAYPHTKGSESRMFGCFRKGCKTEQLDEAEEVEKLIPAIEAQKASRQARISKGLFVPEWKNMAGWLTGAHWLDITPEERDPDAMDYADAVALYKSVGLIPPDARDDK